LCLDLNYTGVKRDWNKAILKREGKGKKRETPCAHLFLIYTDIATEHQRSEIS
jgi:hypothetical protein